MDTHLNTFSWVNSKLKIQKSTIAGECYFAQNDLLKDELLMVQSGQFLHINDIDNTFYEEHSYHGFQVEKEIYIFPFFIDGKPYLDAIFKVNHSCEPNAGFRGQVSLVSMRNITAGEEISFDYAMTDIELKNENSWVPQKCFCRKKTCRKVMTGSDWENPELQAKYNGYFSTHVANAIAQESDNR